jgi:ribosome maturation protein SDO1
MSKSITVKYKGLEILCKPGTIIPYRNQKLDMSNVVITDDAIYKNVKNGNVASEKDLVKAFGEKLELKEALEIMLSKGSFQLTSKERQMLVEQRKARLLNYFNSNFLDPKTNTPHPLSRLEATFTQIKAKINYEMPFDKNCEEIRKAMLGVLPIKPREMLISDGEINTIKKNTAEKTKFGRKKGGKSRFNKN